MSTKYEVDKKFAAAVAEALAVDKPTLTSAAVSVEIADAPRYKIEGIFTKAQMERFYAALAEDDA